MFIGFVNVNEYKHKLYIAAAFSIVLSTFAPLRYCLVIGL